MRVAQQKRGRDEREKELRNKKATSVVLLTRRKEILNMESILIVTKRRGIGSVTTAARGHAGQLDRKKAELFTMTTMTILLERRL